MKMKTRKLLYRAVRLETVFIIIALLSLKILPSVDIPLFDLSYSLLHNENRQVMQEESAEKKSSNYFSGEYTANMMEVTVSPLQFLEEKTAPPMTVFSARFHRGDTLYDVLKKAGISSQKIYHISRSLKPVFNPKHCRPGDSIEVQKCADNEYIILKYVPTGLYYYLVEETGPGKFSARKEKIPGKNVLIGTKGEIKTSLYEAMKEAGLNNELIIRFADIFSWEIDFLTDPRKGDSFQIIRERYVDTQGKVLEEGRILAAQYVNRTDAHTAIFYQDRKGHQGYYDLDGNSVCRSFLRSPLNYTRISSHFSYRRFHPILKIYRPHLGIDYAAPTGTPVSSIGDGVVIFAGWKGDYGRYVKVKHINGYTTSYGHLSRFASGIKSGKKLIQGQVIGYVGATGLATGPHLDFRILKNGKYLNFLNLDLPRGTPVQSAYLNEFKKVKDLYVNYLQVLSRNGENTLVFFTEPLEEERSVSSSIRRSSIV